MVDHSRIRSGYDLELQLSSTFFFQALMAMVESGDLPETVPMGSGTTRIGPPIAVRIGFPRHDVPAEETWDLEVDFDTDLLGRVTLNIALDTELQHNHHIYDNLITGVSLNIRYVSTTAGLTAEMEADLSKVINQKLRNILPGEFQAVETRKLRANTDCQACMAFMINMNIKIGETHKVEHINAMPVVRILPPERTIEPIDRGNADDAVPFLQHHEHIGIGCPQQIFERLGRDILHGFYEKKPNGAFHRPVKDGDTTIGQFKSVSVGPQYQPVVPGQPITAVGNCMVISTKLVTTDPVDIDVKQVTTLTLNTNTEDEVTLDVNVGKPKADTDFWEGLLVIGLIVIGATIAWLSLGSGLLIGGYIGALVSATPLYALRSIVADHEREGRKRAQKEIDKQSGLTTLLTAIPSRVDIVEHRDSPFHNHYYQVRTRFNDILIDQSGISLSGSVETSEDDRTVKKTLLASRTRNDEPNGELQFLEIDVPDYDEIRAIDNFRRLDAAHYPSVFAITTDEAEQLSQEQLIELLRLKVVGQRPSGSRIAELLFDDGAALKPAEAAQLQDRGVLRVYGVQLVKPRGKSPYYRTDPDTRRSNNLNAKPVFRSFRAVRIAQRYEELMLQLEKIFKRTDDAVWRSNTLVISGLTIPALAYHTLSGLVLFTSWIEKIGEGTPPNPTLEQRELAKMFQTDNPQQFPRDEGEQRIPGILPGLTERLMQLNDHAMNKRSHGILGVPNVKNYEFSQAQLDWFEERIDELEHKIKELER